MSDSAQVEEFGLTAAMAIRARTAPLRLFLMLIIAVLLTTVGHWQWSAPWFLGYASLQLAIGRLAAREGAVIRRPTRTAIYVLSAISFVIAGFPTWHMWTECGALGILAATMLLCGMMIQLVTSTLAAKALFLASASPLIAYMIVLPLLGFWPIDRTAALTGSCCALLLAAYLAALWRDYQTRLHAAQALRWDAVAHRKAADAANAAKTTFLANMSHEVRTPMNGVMGAANLLLSTRLEPAQRDLVELILDSGGLMLNVVNDVLELSRIEAGKFQVCPEPTPVPVLIERAAGLWRPKAGEKGLALAVEIEPGAPAEAMIDPNRVKQIIFNLLSNAIKFTDSGAVTLRYSILAGPTGLRLVIEVADTGRGMDAGVMQRIFSPFEQGDASITRKYGGSGIGLSICRKLAEAMAGQITVSSAATIGSTFRIELPFVPVVAAPAGPAERGAKPASVPGLRVLVVDDNQSNRLIIGIYLRQIDAVVTTTGNGQEALDRLDEEPFDLVLMDVRMPVLDGLSATRALRRSGNPNAAIPVLALSANVMASDLKECAAAGMTGHVAKPIEPAALFSAISAALAHSATLDQPATARSA